MVAQEGGSLLAKLGSVIRGFAGQCQCSQPVGHGSAMCSRCEMLAGVFCSSLCFLHAQSAVQQSDLCVTKAGLEGCL